MAHPQHIARLSPPQKPETLYKKNGEIIKEPNAPEKQHLAAEITRDHLARLAPLCTPLPDQWHTKTCLSSS